MKAIAPNLIKLVRNWIVRLSQHNFADFQKVTKLIVELWDT